MEASLHGQSKPLRPKSGTESEKLSDNEKVKQSTVSAYFTSTSRSIRIFILCYSKSRNFRAVHIFCPQYTCMDRIVCHLISM